MKTVTLTIGISASGKSTWAKEKVKSSKGSIVNLNKDDIRFMLFGVDGWKDYKFTKEREKLVSAFQKDMANHALQEGKSIIISDTNLKEGKRQYWKDLAKTHNAKYVEEVFHVDVEECQRRNAYRSNGIPPEDIYKQYKKFMSEFGPEPYYGSTSLPNCIIVDIDGTLAHMHNRGPFEWDKVGNDSVHWDIVRYLEMLNDYSVYDIKIILLSGRDGVCRKETEQWLTTWRIPYDALFMREQGNCEKDTIIKERLCREHIIGKYNVLHVIDDRPCVCDMWRDVFGFKVWQVADPRIRF